MPSLTLPPPSLWRALLDACLPLRRVGRDPLGCADGRRFQPLSVARLRLPPTLCRELLATRANQSSELSLSGDRRLTVIVPYRNRPAQLAAFLPAIQAFLERQGLDFRVVVVEQAAGKPFNRGKLINVGVAATRDGTDYYCIHDVDMLPRSADYRCPSQPLRLVTNLAATWRAKTRFEGTYFSGAITLTREQLLAVNGFANDFWGWGKEDDDFLYRLLRQGLVPFIDGEGTFEELPNPADQAPDQKLLEQNRRKKHAFFRGRRDPAQNGLNTLDFRLTQELREGVRTTRLCVEI